VNQSFNDRLARIQTHQQSASVAGAENIDLIGQTKQNKLPSMEELYPTQKPKTYNQKFNMAIVNNILLGILWMGPTGFVAANLLPTADFFAGTGATQDSVFNVRMGLGIGVVTSLGLFYWVFREAVRDLGKAHGMPMSLVIGGAIGGLIGAGPIAVFNLLTNGADSSFF